jgi:hypothetical protein
VEYTFERSAEVVVKVGFVFAVDVVHDGRQHRGFDLAHL